MILLRIHHKIMADSAATDGRLARENYANSFNKFWVMRASERKSRRKHFFFAQLCRNGIGRQKTWCERKKKKKKQGTECSEKPLCSNFLLPPSPTFFPSCIKQSDLWPTFMADGMENAFMTRSPRRRVEGDCKAKYSLPTTCLLLKNT